MKNSLLILTLLFSLSVSAGSLHSSKTATEQVQKKKIHKLLDSKLGNLILKKVYIKSQKKALRKQLKGFEGSKAEKRAYKKEQKRILKDESATKLSGNMRTGVILAIIGLILTFLPQPLSLIGVILIIVGLVFILLDLL